MSEEMNGWEALGGGHEGEAGKDKIGIYASPSIKSCWPENIENATRYYCLYMIKYRLYYSLS